MIKLLELFWIACRLLLQPVYLCILLWRLVCGRGHRIIFYMKSGNKIEVDLKNFTLKGTTLSWVYPVNAKDGLRHIDFNQIEGITVKY